MEPAKMDHKTEETTGASPMDPERLADVRKRIEAAAELMPRLGDSTLTALEAKALLDDRDHWQTEACEALDREAAGHAAERHAAVRDGIADDLATARDGKAELVAMLRRLSAHASERANALAEARRDVDISQTLRRDVLEGKAQAYAHAADLAKAEP